MLLNKEIRNIFSTKKQDFKINLTHVLAGDPFLHILFHVGYFMFILSRSLELLEFPCLAQS